jgi:hypothetical protein
MRHLAFCLSFMLSSAIAAYSHDQDGRPASHRSQQGDGRRCAGSHYGELQLNQGRREEEPRERVGDPGKRPSEKYTANWEAHVEHSEPSSERTQGCEPAMPPAVSLAVQDGYVASRKSEVLRRAGCASGGATSGERASPGGGGEGAERVWGGGVTVANWMLRQLDDKNWFDWRRILYAEREERRPPRHLWASTAGQAGSGTRPKNKTLLDDGKDVKGVPLPSGYSVS